MNFVDFSFLLNYDHGFMIAYGMFLEQFEFINFETYIIMLFLLSTQTEVQYIKDTRIVLNMPPSNSFSKTNNNE